MRFARRQSFGIDPALKQCASAARRETEACTHSAAGRLTSGLPSTSAQERIASEVADGPEAEGRVGTGCGSTLSEFAASKCCQAASKTNLIGSGRRECSPSKDFLHQSMSRT